MWWQWGLWADLRSPTIYVPFDDDVLAEAQHVLAAYAGELRAQRLRVCWEHARSAHAVLGSERVFGFGTARWPPRRSAELLTECRLVDGHWRPGSPRLLDPSAPASDLSR